MKLEYLCPYGESTDEHPAGAGPYLLARPTPETRMYPPSVCEGEMRLKVADGDPAAILVRILTIFLSLAKFVTRPPVWAHWMAVVKVSR